MKQNRAKMSVAVAILALASVIVVCSIPSEATMDDDILVDFGNGKTHWASGTSGSLYDSLDQAIADAGSKLSFDDVLSVDGVSVTTIGDVTSSWRIFEWKSEGWNDITDTVDLDSPYSGGTYALGHYPEGILPVETPIFKSSWTMIRGDSNNTGHQTTLEGTEPGSVSWDLETSNANYVNVPVLVAGDKAFVVTGGGYTANQPDPELFCMDRSTGEKIWSFEYNTGVGYETACGVIVGDHYYLPATEGCVYKIPLSGPGEDNSLVGSVEIPTSSTGLDGMRYFTGPASMIYDSGVLYFGTSNGSVYCMDLDLNVIWTSPVGGPVYYSTPTVYGDHLIMGALNGVLYVFDRYTGELEAEETVYQTTIGSKGEVRGSANVAVAVDDVIMLSYSDGQGMNTTMGGMAAYRITDTGLVEVFKKEVGLTGSFILPVETTEFSGAYFMTGYGMKRISTSGEIDEMVGGLGSFKGPITLVNDEHLYVAEYDSGGNIYIMDLDGNILGSLAQPESVAQFCMTPVTVVDGMIYLGTDGGAFGFSGSLPEPVGASDSEGGVPWGYITIIAIVAMIVASLAYMYRLKQETDMPFLPFLRQKIASMSGFNNERMSKVGRNKRRLALVLVIGAIIAIVLFITSLCVGPSGNYRPIEALEYAYSALEKTISNKLNGTEYILTHDENIIFNSRCSRAVAAFAVGVGLSISGSIYQAIIRNPMVDPYIMGVSAGAGVAAIATIAFNFTFFGLIDNITFVTPIVAMIGGVIAFGCTMLLAEKAGGSSLNYVLAGIIIGLVFSAVQTLMLSMAGEKLNDAMSWLFGSFSNINWTSAILVTVPAIAMSLAPMVWAKEFNLVLLGEDQARQMGLDVRRFNRWMLILASVLASVCVAFVGIIGFVGLVVPHLCRMILGGDHRLVMPASIVVGGALMMAADLFSKMAMVPLELPVGAITTVIGAPVFAYLLIKKGRMYDG